MKVVFVAVKRQQMIEENTESPVRCHRYSCRRWTSDQSVQVGSNAALWRFVRVTDKMWSEGQEELQRKFLIIHIDDCSLCMSAPDDCSNWRILICVGQNDVFMLVLHLEQSLLIWKSFCSEFPFKTEYLNIFLNISVRSYSSRVFNAQSVAVSCFLFIFIFIFLQESTSWVR